MTYGNSNIKKNANYSMGSSPWVQMRCCVWRWGPLCWWIAGSTVISVGKEEVCEETSFCVFSNVPYRTGLPQLKFAFWYWKNLEYISGERLRWSRGSVLAFSTQVRGFKPGRSRRIFKGQKILSTPSFEGEVKPLECKNP